MRRIFLALVFFFAAQTQGFSAACTWTGGTGSWNNSNTASWSCGHVPVAADTVTFDGTSGGGTVTVNDPNGSGVVTVQSITCGAFTGTLDFSANNNSVTLTAGTNAFNGSGTGTRTFNLGNGTWTLSGTGGNPWNLGTTTNLTFNANSSVIVLSGTTAVTRSFISGGKIYATISFSANSSGGIYKFTGTPTVATLNMTAPLAFSFVDGGTTTIINALSLSGSSSSQFMLSSDAYGTTATVSSANNGAVSWAGIRDLTFTGGGAFTAANSFNLGNNSGITITAPTTSGGGFVIGGL